MISVLQLLMIGCAISVIWLNENLHNSSIMTLLEQSENFGELHRKVLIAFYSVSIFTSVVGLLSPLTFDAVDGVNPILNAYRVMGCVHVLTLGGNFGLHLTLYIKSENVLEALDVQALYERGGISKEISQAINFMQRNHKCCGLYKPADWEKIFWWTDNITALYSHKIPKSCCSVKQCTYAAKLSTRLTTHKVGCRKKIHQELLVFLRYNWVFPLSILVAQVIVIILAFILIRLMKYTAEELAENEDDEKMFFTNKRLAKLKKQTLKKFWKILKSESESEEEDEKRKDHDDDDDYREKRRKKLRKTLKMKKLKRERKRKKGDADDDVLQKFLDIGPERELDREELRKKKAKRTDDNERFYSQDREEDATRNLKDRGEIEHGKESKIPRRDRELVHFRDREKDYYDARERAHGREEDKFDRRNREKEKYERREPWDDREMERHDKKEKRRAMYGIGQNHLSNYLDEDYHRNREQTSARDLDFSRSDDLKDTILDRRYEKFSPKNGDQYDFPYRKSEKTYYDRAYDGPDARLQMEEFQRRKPVNADYYHDEFKGEEKQRLDMKSNQILDKLTAAEIANVAGRENGEKLKLREDRLRRLKRRQRDELRRLQKLSMEENREMEKIKELNSPVDPGISPPIAVQTAPTPAGPRTTVPVSIAPTSEKPLTTTTTVISNIDSDKPTSSINIIKNKPSEVSSNNTIGAISPNINVKPLPVAAATVATTATTTATTATNAAIATTMAVTAAVATTSASATTSTTATDKSTASASNRKYSTAVAK